MIIDRVSRFPGRVRIVPEDGSPAFYAVMERADEPSEPGTPLNSKNLTAANIGAIPEARIILDEYTDLNNIKIPGRYQSVSLALSNTIINKPSDVSNWSNGFALDVIQMRYANSTDQTIQQIMRSLSYAFMRRATISGSTTTWTPWLRMLSGYESGSLSFTTLDLPDGIIVPGQYMTKEVFFKTAFITKPSIVLGLGGLAGGVRLTPTYMNESINGFTCVVTNTHSISISANIGVGWMAIAQ